MGRSVPAIPSCIIDPIWEQVRALVPEHHDEHPLGCHRPRIDDRLVFDKLVQVLVFGCAYERIADHSCSATTLRRRRDEWIDAGVMDKLERAARDGYDRMVGLELADLSLDGCLAKAPCGGERAGRSPVDRGKRGTKRPIVVDAAGIPLGVLSAPANCHDSPLLAPTLDLLANVGPLPEQVTVHLDRGYDSGKTRSELAARGLRAEIACKGTPAPIQAGQRWVVERTNAWHNAHRKLLICTERRAAVIDFWISLANAIIIVRRLIRRTWTSHRWDTRPRRRP
jgi:transposase